MWRMIWQETGEVAVVVMLTKTFELGRDKCFQYFPNAETEPLEVRDEDNEFGDDFVATITLVEKKRDPRSSCTVRKLELRVGDKVKTVWHLLFKGWPDYNVPEGEDKSALLELIRLANEKNSGPENPLIVHCARPRSSNAGRWLTTHQAARASVARARLLRSTTLFAILTRGRSRRRSARISFSIPSTSSANSACIWSKARSSSSSSTQSSRSGTCGGPSRRHRRWCTYTRKRTRLVTARRSA